jgi:hypothetical protein
MMRVVLSIAFGLTLFACEEEASEPEIAPEPAPTPVTQAAPVPVTEPVPVPPPDPVAEPEETPAPSTGNPLIDCTLEADYNACIIRDLTEPSTPREYEGLINAYREKGERDRACELMREVMEAYPTSPAARRFSQYTQRMCP